MQGGTFLLAYNVLKGGGQISDTEGREAKAALNKLQHTDVDEATYRKNLQEFRDEIVKLKEIARQRAAAGIVAPGAAPAGAPAAGAPDPLGIR
jgi:flagellar protein FlgJ